jgi:putative toxin-antitoxin system antitoxin component (TIGR02293 family)
MTSVPICRQALDEAETAERLSRTIEVAETVFQSKEDIRRFMTTPHPLLEGRAPMDMCQTSTGMQRVQDLLLGMKFGGVV